ncbi:hypothetical protein [Rhodopirellula sp. P2]|uniref:hypothetical protein n=1 Tax=Rhodopirellula sp. P2 TaxID=2127060 RepID=UPI002368D01F|nr:hypothetical protein [Rhodopirellula sp. P2]WDQ16290.1 hypothetical protein PSR62_22075 [Rhodopirellula sp. P2]
MSRSIRVRPLSMGGPHTNAMSPVAVVSSTRNCRRAALAAIVLVGSLTAGQASVAAQDVRSSDQFSEQRSLPDRDGSEANRVSDWGLAGVIWSDASLVRKLASESALRTKDPQQVAEFEQWVRQSTEVIQSLESFGWKLRGQQAEQSGKPVTEASQAMAERMPVSSAHLSSEQSETQEQEPLPDSTDVGEALAKELRGTRPSMTVTIDGSDPRDEPSESVVESDDEGDETLAENASLPAAVEDGVADAIAPATGRLDTGRELGSEVNDREMQTLSETLPYSGDSLDGADDPERDDRVDNPLAAERDSATGIDFGDRDGDLGRRTDPRVIERADEMLAELTAEEMERKVPATQRRSNRQRFTTEKAVQQRDAQWGQSQLASNELVLTHHTTLQNLQQRTREAVVKLKSNASVAGDTTDNEQLKAVLKVISKF